MKMDRGVVVRSVRPVHLCRIPIDTSHGAGRKVDKSKRRACLRRDRRFCHGLREIPCAQRHVVGDDGGRFDLAIEMLAGLRPGHTRAHRGCALQSNCATSRFGVDRGTRITAQHVLRDGQSPVFQTTLDSEIVVHLAAMPNDAAPPSSVMTSWRASASSRRRSACWTG